MCVLLLVSACVCFAQDGTWAVPDNPAPQAAQVCHYEWSVPQGSASGEQVGHEVCHSASVAATWRVIPEQKSAVSFFSFRKRWQDPPLRTNAQMLHSKVYVASMIGGALAMVVACRNPRSGEDWGSEVPAVLGVDAMSFFAGRLFTMPFAVAPGAYEMFHYARAATK